MIPEIGQFALILALSLAICQAVLPLVGAHRGNVAMMEVGRTAAAGQFLFVAVAFACLTWSFINDDFSVLYVANHSQLSLPTLYKVSAVWGAHEGSLLLWILLLASWMPGPLRGLLPRVWTGDPTPTTRWPSRGSVPACPMLLRRA